MAMRPGQTKTQNGKTYRLNENHRWELDERDETSTFRQHHTETPQFKAWFDGSRVVDAEGKPQVVFHGTGRADRIGDRFRKARATSGPMQYFTDDPEIASSYSTNKKDTSFERPSDYAGWFKWQKPGSKATVNIDQAWYYLPAEKQAAIRAALPTIGYTNSDEGDGPIVAGSESPMPNDSIQWELREARGNALRALVEIWLSSGQLYNQEQRFLEVLRAVGVNADLEDPDHKQSAVYPVYLDIKNPLDTASIPPEVVSALEQAGKRKRAKNPAGGDPDPWDKNTISGPSWIAYLKNDLAIGTTHAWTRVPDWATDTLQKMGYDGIKDTGGKHGGIKHTVWVPFREDQIKSKHNRGTWDRATGNMLMAIRLGLSPTSTVAFRMAIDASGLSPDAKGELGRPDASLLASSGFDAARWIRDEARSTLEFWTEFKEFRNPRVARELRSLLGDRITRMSLAWDPDDDDEDEIEDTEDSDEEESGDVMDRAEQIADFLESIYGDKAEEMFDAVFGSAVRMAAWNAFEHPRGPNGRFIKKNSPEAVAAARARVEDALKGDRNHGSMRTLVDHLAILTHSQLRDLKRDYDIRASGTNRAQLIDKIADRLDRGRRKPTEEVDADLIEAGNRKLLELIEKHAGEDGLRVAKRHNVSILQPFLPAADFYVDVRRAIMSDLRDWYKTQGIDMPSSWVPASEEEDEARNLAAIEETRQKAKSLYEQAQQYKRKAPPIEYRSLDLHFAILGLRAFEEVDSMRKTLTELQSARWAMLDHELLIDEQEVFESLWEKNKKGLFRKLEKHNLLGIFSDEPKDEFNIDFFLERGLKEVNERLNAQRSDMEDGIAISSPNWRNIPGIGRERAKWYKALKNHVAAGNLLTKEQLITCRYEDWVPQTQRFQLVTMETKRAHSAYMRESFLVHRPFVTKAIAKVESKVEALITEANRKVERMLEDRTAAAGTHWSMVKEYQAWRMQLLSTLRAEKRTMTPQENEEDGNRLRAVGEHLEIVDKMRNAEREVFLSALFTAPKEKTIKVPLPTEWAELLGKGSFIKQELSRQQIAEFEAAEDFINLVTEGRLSLDVPTSWTTSIRSYERLGKIHIYPRARADVIVHELGHVIEGLNGNRLGAMSRAFAMASIEGHNETPEHLGGNYRADEIGSKNGFESEYTGKFYPYSASEVLSMGLQSLFQYPVSFARQFPEHFRYTIAAIKGWIA